MGETTRMLRGGIAAFAEINLTELRQLNMAIPATPIPIVTLLAGKLIDFLALLAIES